MITDSYRFPSQDEIEQAILDARRVRAATLRAGLRHGLRATAHWLAHPSLHPQQA